MRDEHFVSGGYCRDSAGIVHKVICESDDGSHYVLVCGTDQEPRAIDVLLAIRLDDSYVAADHEKCGPDGCWD